MELMFMKWKPFSSKSVVCWCLVIFSLLQHDVNGIAYSNPCPKLGSGTIAHPVDCSSFIRCVSGFAYEIQCAANLHFNAELKVCDHAYKTPCKTNHDTTKKNAPLQQNVKGNIVVANDAIISTVAVPLPTAPPMSSLVSSPGQPIVTPTSNPALKTSTTASNVQSSSRRPATFLRTAIPSSRTSPSPTPFRTMFPASSTTSIRTNPTSSSAGSSTTSFRTTLPASSPKSIRANPTSSHAGSSTTSFRTTLPSSRISPSVTPFRTTLPSAYAPSSTTSIHTKPPSSRSSTTTRFRSALPSSSSTPLASVNIIEEDGTRKSYVINDNHNSASPIVLADSGITIEIAKVNAPDSVNSKNQQQNTIKSYSTTRTAGNSVAIRPSKAPSTARIFTHFDAERGKTPRNRGKGKSLSSSKNTILSRTISRRSYNQPLDDYSQSAGNNYRPPPTRNNYANRAQAASRAQMKLYRGSSGKQQAAETVYGVNQPNYQQNSYNSPQRQNIGQSNTRQATYLNGHRQNVPSQQSSANQYQNHQRQQLSPRNQYEMQQSNPVRKSFDSSHLPPGVEYPSPSIDMSLIPKAPSFSESEGYYPTPMQQTFINSNSQSKLQVPTQNRRFSNPNAQTATNQGQSQFNIQKQQTQYNQQRQPSHSIQHQQQGLQTISKQYQQPSSHYKQQSGKQHQQVPYNYLQLYKQQQNKQHRPSNVNTIKPSQQQYQIVNQQRNNNQPSPHNSNRQIFNGQQQQQQQQHRQQIQQRSSSRQNNLPAYGQNRDLGNRVQNNRGQNNRGQHNRGQNNRVQNNKGQSNRGQNNRHHSGQRNLFQNQQNHHQPNSFGRHSNNENQNQYAPQDGNSQNRNQPGQRAQNQPQSQGRAPQGDSHHSGQGKPPTFENFPYNFLPTHLMGPQFDPGAGVESNGDDFSSSSHTGDKSQKGENVRSMTKRRTKTLEETKEDYNFTTDPDPSLNVSGIKKTPLTNDIDSVSDVHIYRSTFNVTGINKTSLTNEKVRMLYETLLSGPWPSYEYVQYHLPNIEHINKTAGYRYERRKRRDVSLSVATDAKTVIDEGKKNGDNDVMVSEKRRVVSSTEDSARDTEIAKEKRSEHNNLKLHTKKKKVPTATLR